MPQPNSISHHFDHHSLQLDAMGASLHAIQPVAALLLDVGVSYQEFARLTRRAYVEEAAARQVAIGARPSISRIAAATGMSRPDVSQILTSARLAIEPSDLSRRPADRVIAAWTNDADYLLDDGTPKSLAYADSRPSFSDLVRTHGPDIPPRAMLNELLACKRVSETEAGRYLPTKEKSQPRPAQRDAIRDFGAKLNTFGFTLLKNLRSETKKPLFETMTTVSNMPTSLSAKIARELERRCRTFSQSIERFLLDQGQRGDKKIAPAPCHEFGVMVAVVENPCRPANSAYSEARTSDL